MARSVVPEVKKRIFPSPSCTPVYDQLPQQHGRRVLIQHDQLQPGQIRREELDHTIHASVGKQTHTGFAGFPQFLCPLPHILP